MTTGVEEARRRLAGVRPLEESEEARRWRELTQARESPRSDPRVKPLDKFA